MKIPFSPPDITEAEIEQVAEALRSGWITTGPKTKELEREVADLCGTNRAVCLNSQTACAEMTLRLLGIHEGDEVITCAYTYTASALQKTGNPYDPFALQKACLLACGIIPYKNGNLKEILARFGGGFELHSEVVNVPKGSGLGTSSILSAACVKAIFEFMGIVHTEKDIYDHVLLMEQIMSTGGGWQDQVGGVTNGIKYNFLLCNLY